MSTSNVGVTIKSYVVYDVCLHVEQSGNTSLGVK